MPYNTKRILTDEQGKPIPQYFDPVADAYQPLYGRNGATRVELYDASGNPITVDSGKLAVRASEIEAILGEVSSTPTANTLADRLKQIADRLGEVSANPTANTALARLKTIEGYVDGLEAALGTTADPEATSNGSVIALLKRLRTLLTESLVAGVHDQSATVPAGGYENVQIYASAGTLAELVNWGIVVPAPPGATSGTHRVVVSLSSTLSVQRILEVTANYSQPIEIYAGVVASTVQSEWPTDKAAQATRARGIFISDAIPLVIQYQNNTNADQTSVRYYRTWRRERKVA